MITLNQHPDGGLVVTMSKRGHETIVDVLQPGQDMVLIFPGLDVRISPKRPTRARGPKPHGAFYDEAVEFLTPKEER